MLLLLLLMMMRALGLELVERHLGARARAARASPLSWWIVWIRKRGWRLGLYIVGA
jgi:hypothetical protein